jgi:NitT/TauT family transport system substrate-binding protein
MFVNYLLVKNGMSPQDVSIVGTPSSAARVSALEHGKVDAAILPEPGITVLKKRHPREMSILADLTSEAGLEKNFGTDVYPGTILISTSAWLRQNSETAHHLARAIQRSLRYPQNRPKTL